VTKLDLAAIVFVALTAFLGYRKGLIASALSVAGIVLGAYAGSRLGPELLAGGSRSPYTPLAALAGAAVGAILLEAAGTVIGTALRSGLRIPPLRTLDSAGGLVLGAGAGLALVWVVGAAALLLPGQQELRRTAQRSVVLRQLNELVPPSRLLHALARIDPFPAIAGPSAPVAPPDPRLLRAPGVRRAAPSVVRVLGTACGLGIAGSGWVAARGLVVTAAHVVAGERDTIVEEQSGVRHSVVPVEFDRRNDVAVLRVSDLPAPPLRLVEAVPGTPVAILGFPENGPFAAAPGRIGRTAVVLTEDAYGRGPVTRAIVSVRGRVRHGNSGGPAVDRRGAVEASIFAARIGSDVGLGVPAAVVRRALAAAREPVSTGDCAP
jgi:S1-C subfamily serine protease